MSSDVSDGVVRRNRKRKLSGIDNMTLLSDYFGRKFRYSPSTIEFDTCLNGGSNDHALSKCQTIVELQEVKADLNTTKNLLNSVDIAQWRKHTQYMHRGGEVVRHIKKDIKPELCTKAWCKFYEILSHFSLHLYFGEVFNSFHLCEAPGAFVTSLNHFLHVKGYEGQWKWGANTLNPLYEGNGFGCMIDSDNFIKETLDNWCFGDDDTGDIMVLENIECIQQICERDFEGGIDLVTCDGSFDCANEPEDQEKNVFALHFCELVASLSILRKGGVMVLKMFTMFENPAIGLMYLLSGLFEELYVFKPVTSKPGNSEVYVVAMKFLGISKVLLDKLKHEIKTGRFKQDLELFTTNYLPESFLKEHVECCKLFSGWQKETILENVDSYLNTCNSRSIYLEKKYLCKEFLNLYEVRRMKKEFQIVPNQSTQQFVPGGLDGDDDADKGHVGSLLERRKALSLPVLERLSSMEMFQVEDSDHFNLQHMKLPEMNEKWKIIRGKMFDRIGSSKFCRKSFLWRLNECFRNELVSLNGENLKNVEDGLFEDDIPKKLKELNITGICSTDSNITPKLELLSRESGAEIVEQNLSGNGHLRIEHLIACGGSDTAYIIPSQNCVSRFIQILVTMRSGCSLLLPLGALITRISAQMFLLLLSHFQQVSIFRCGRLPYLCIFAGSFLGISQDVRDKLNDVCDAVDKESIGGRVVLSFLPTRICSDVEVMSILHDINNDYLKMRINYFLTLFQRADK